MAFWVRDDKLVFDEEAYCKRWDGDAVEVYFDGDLVHLDQIGYDHNDGQIRITLEQAGKTVLEGEAGLLETMMKPPLIPKELFAYVPPYAWELVGVEAVLKVGEGGYTVEVKLPKEVLGIKAFSRGTQIGMNLRVLDDDDGGRMDRLMDWAGDVENLSYKSPVNFGRVVISRVIESSELSLSPTERVTVAGGGKELEVRIGDGRESAYGAIRALWGRAYASAIEKLTQIGEKVEVWPLLGWVEQKAGRYEQGITTFQKFMDAISRPKAQMWALEEIAGSYLAMGAYEKAVEVYEEALSHEESPSPRLLIRLGGVYRGQSRYQEAIAQYQRLIAQSPGIAEAALAQYEIGCTYAEQHRYDQALPELQKVLDQYPDVVSTDDLAYTCRVMASLYTLKRDYLRAMRMYKRIIEEYPDSKWADQAKWWFQKYQKMVH